MEIKRTQAERSATTRAALVAASRGLFAEHGYAALSTDQIAKAAGVTRGALYHQFAGKEELFAAVFEQVESEIAERIDAYIEAAAPSDVESMLGANIDAWLATCAEPEFHRIALIEAPAALGWERWREVGLRYGVGLVESALRSLIDAGLVADRPVRPLAHVLVGALDEAALYCAQAEDRVRATAEVCDALLAVLTGLLAR
ncbi:MAG TPA: TetR/AcrR family transcriptional regulator [Nocardioides sp.]|nr:TetR/AcrR family transcriptional regulator [Nocardioides sp.]